MGSALGGASVSQHQPGTQGAGCFSPPGYSHDNQLLFSVFQKQNEKVLSSTAPEKLDNLFCIPATYPSPLILKACYLHVLLKEKNI